MELKLNKSKLILIAILIFALAVRLYFLFRTNQQALWWDEAEYAIQAKNFAGLTANSASILRPIMLPFILAPFVKFGFSDLGLRSLEIVFAMAGLLFTYLLTKEVFKKKAIAFAATFLMSISWIILFYTNRLMTEIPSLAFFLAGAYFLLKSYPENKISYSIAGGICLALGFLTRFPVAIIMLALALFIVISKRLAALKSKNTWIALTSFVLTTIPYFVWAQFKFGNPLAPIKLGSEGAGGLTLGFPSLITYLKWLPHYFSIPLLVFFAVGLVILFANVVFNYKSLLKDKHEYLLILLWLFIPVVYFSMQPHAEDRYLIVAIVPALMLIAFTLNKVYELLKSKSKIVAVFIVFSLLMAFASFDLYQANRMIDAKADSFAQVKEAGLWIEKNSAPKDVIYSASGPQLEYYSERNVLPYPNTKEEFEAQIKDNAPKYITLSVLEPHPEWAYNYSSGLVPVQVYQLQNNPVFVVYAMPEANA
jgi:4-amino-4-deoxy-L-arabinose transferase-like glycosyltransferase